MLNSNDIYAHLLNGGAVKDLYVALDKEINEANKKIKAAKEAEQKANELAEKIKKARQHAVAALKDYFTLVNPDVTEDIIHSVLDTLETLKISVNGTSVRSRGDLYDIFELFR
jgi:hypothetical protein